MIQARLCKITALHRKMPSATCSLIEGAPVGVCQTARSVQSDPWRQLLVGPVQVPAVHPGCRILHSSSETHKLYVHTEGQQQGLRLGHSGKCWESERTLCGIFSQVGTDRWGLTALGLGRLTHLQGGVHSGRGLHGWKSMSMGQGVC